MLFLLTTTALGDSVSPDELFCSSTAEIQLMLHAALTAYSCTCKINEHASMSFEKLLPPSGLLVYV